MQEQLLFDPVPLLLLAQALATLGCKLLPDLGLLQFVFLLGPGALLSQVLQFSWRATVVVDKAPNLALGLVHGSLVVAELDQVGHRGAAVVQHS